VDYTYSFPSPPEAGNEALEQRSWYYYLAEIASRHLVNRVTRAQCQILLEPTESAVARMLGVIDVFEPQLAEWYSSLPPFVSFKTPKSHATPMQDELSQHLFSRYLHIREILYRPFVHLCVMYSLDLPDGMLMRVIDAANLCLAHCLHRIESTTVTRHHGLWFQLRSFVTCSLVLIAVERAKKLPLLNVAALLELPSGWKNALHSRKGILYKYQNKEVGGVENCYSILDWALDECGS
jgi:hypothetical protein